LRESKEIWLKIAFTLLIIGFSFSSYSFGFLSHFYIHNLIFPNVRVRGVNIGGLSLEGAKGYLENMEKGIKFKLRWLNGEREFSMKEVGLGVDIEEVLRRAYEIGRRGWTSAFREAWICLWKGIDVEAEIKVKDKRRWENFLAFLRKSTNKPARDARPIVERGRVVDIIPAESGYAVDEEKLLTMLAKGGGGYIELPMKELLPKVREEDLEGMELLSEFSTSIAGSSAGRRENIKKAVSAIDGTLISPGESFSFNEKVGPRVSERGYKIAPVMVRGELVPGVGGGVCQVSTTLYNAVLLAGLKVVRREHHARPVKYVSPGRDATVVYGYIDLIFKNDKDAPIYIQGEVKGGRIIFRIFGRRDFESIKIYSDVVRKGDGTIIAKTYRVIDFGSEKRSELISTDIYRPLPPKASAQKAVERELHP
jgi:vancomycin resistance protein YoaR